MLDEQKESDGLVAAKPVYLYAKSQKIAVAVLAFFALAVIVGWIYQFKKSLSQPFAYTEDDSQLSTGDSVSEEARLKAADTDKDGLKDWDELNLYNTSPFLEDSDSDGFKDKDEIDSENDPNCPTGRNCYSEGIVEGDASVTKVNAQAKPADLPAAPETPAVDTQLSDDQIKNMFGDDLSPAVIRQKLINNGMPKETLDQISDEELLQSLKEIVSNQ